VVAQVDEQQLAVIALAMNPARQADRLADVACAQRGAGMGTIGVHQEVGLLAENAVENGAPRFTGGKAFVNPASRR
jgi:hypothetical protein